MPQGTWYIWTTTSSNTTALSYNETIWQGWNVTSTSSTAITYDVNSVRYVEPPPLTKAQLRELRRQEVARQREAERYVEERNAALKRAEDLLVSMLNEQQKQQFELHGEFQVIGSKGGQYVIRRGYAGNVISGRRRYCGHLSDSRIPQADHMLAQKLMIETNEEAYLAVANDVSY